ncbi:two-component sensor histidine kinase [Tumebacillus sp. ITR2]|uniref:histidine kinase n=1 Tax=Tumebacillus amylolyticus TaxID=2801339 RepID=A0ABS1J4F2_9BACL|nr:HAMP domain-containing sensor histidine kinase [Tumebacillus amylolyticus]MBL0385154.1 two-component sensor histidine kinase [Tumebacillus amylolyticus]
MTKRPATRYFTVARVLASIGIMMSASAAAFIMGYFLTKWGFAATGAQWPDFARQLLNWFVGSLLMVAAILVFNLFARPKQIEFWGEINGALKRIAKGDFNIVLDREEKFQGQLRDFVDTLNHMAHELKQMETLRQELISNVSHEIQSPLTSIRGFANTLQNDDLSPEDRRHYLSIIETESTRLSKLSDNLLKLTSLESEHQPFEPTPYRLDIQLRNVILACEPQWLEKDLELELDLPETTVVADEELMGQVWTNLIHNAIKFTPPHGSLQLVLEKTESGIRVSITDTGIGISPEDQLRIFERFYKGDKSRTRSITGGGSGLGLAIVKKIIDLHAGSVRVRSQAGVGSTFEVQLPKLPSES